MHFFFIVISRDAVMFLTLEALRILGILLQPVLPSTCAKLLEHIGVPAEKRLWQHAECTIVDMRPPLNLHPNLVISQSSILPMNSILSSPASSTVSSHPDAILSAPTSSTTLAISNHPPHNVLDNSSSPAVEHFHPHIHEHLSPSRLHPTSTSDSTAHSSHSITELLASSHDFKLSSEIAAKVGFIPGQTKICVDKSLILFPKLLPVDGDGSASIATPDQPSSSSASKANVAKLQKISLDPEAQEQRRREKEAKKREQRERSMAGQLKKQKQQHQSDDQSAKKPPSIPL
jgi:hypothetical protein